MLLEYKMMSMFRGTPHINLTVTYINLVDVNFICFWIVMPPFGICEMSFSLLIDHMINAVERTGKNVMIRVK